MKKIYLIIAALFAMLAGGLALSGPASANQTPALDMVTVTAADPSFATCPNLDGWYVNSPDEDNRKPVPTVEGLKFSGSQLIHHASADLKLADLGAGSFVATAAPDQPSFFSVELRDKTTGGYGTLRYNTKTSKWDLTTNTNQYAFDHPSDAIGTQTKYGVLTENTRVISFGIGYTSNPAGTVETVVTKVTFDGKTYPLDCKPAPTKTPSSPAPTKTSSKPTPIKSHSSSPAGGAAGTGSNGGDSGALAITGPSTPKLIGISAAILIGGGAALWAARRRRVKFTS